MIKLCYAFLGLSLLASPLYAQGKRGKPVFEIPKTEEAPKDDGQKPKPSSIDAQIQRLKGWPSLQSRRAAETLIVRRERAVDAVYNALISSDPQNTRLKPGAAYVLGYIGEKKHAVDLILTMAEPGQHKQASVFLEAAYRRDPILAVRESFRFFRLGTTRLRQAATRFVLNRITKDHYEDVLVLLDRERSPKGYTREIGLRLLNRLETSGQMSAEDVRPVVRKALGDSSPRVARRAMLLVSVRDDEENRAALNLLVTEGTWRERSYAALALARLTNSATESAFTAESVEVLRGARGLSHPVEMMVRATSAISLAEVALLTGRQDLYALLDREVPIVLIDSVGGSGRHFIDFSSVQRPCYSMLRRITGENFRDQAPVWMVWWRDHGTRFKARRPLLGVAERELDITVLDLDLPQSDERRLLRFEVVGTKPPHSRLRRVYALTRNNMKSAVELLRAGDFFDTPESDPGQRSETQARIVVRVGSLSRAVHYDTKAPTPEASRVVAKLKALAAEYRWQHWWDTDAQPSWPLFFTENAQWFAGTPDADARVVRMREMLTAAIDDIVTVDQRVLAMRELVALPGGAKALSQEATDRLIGALATEPDANEFGQAVVDFLVPAAGPQNVRKVFEAVARKRGAGSHTLLGQVCGALGPDVLRLLMRDERWQVRRAAIEALGESGPAAGRSELVERLADTDPLVREAAADALAKLRDPALLPALQALGNDTSPRVRSAAGFAIGGIGTPAARKAVEPYLLRDASRRVRLRAIAGLRRAGGGRDTAELLLRVFEAEEDSGVRIAAGRALVTLESPALVRQLIERLELTPAASNERVALVAILSGFSSVEVAEPLRRVLRGDDTASADAAALGLARRRDPTAITQLISMVRRQAHARDAVRHLQLLSSRSFDLPDYEEQAKSYENWAVANADGNPRLWFRDALADRGYDVSPLATWVAGDALSNEAIPLLLRVLRDSGWYLAANASKALSDRMGPDGPAALDHNNSREEVEAAIRAYVDWWREEKRRLNLEEE
ncbi:MAG: HEAT repeat domain-containing protein [Planctomycetota bacterium]|nr:HEAT repeat domain-containing protein [Planctomycetota bacterium]